MRTRFALFLSLFISIFSVSAFAQWEASKSVTLTSQYVSPALYVINDRAVVQPDLHFVNNDGTYADVFATIGLAKSGGNEIDFTLGKTKRLTGKLEGFSLTGEVAIFAVIQPEIIKVFAPSLNIQHVSGLNLKVEGRSASGQSFGHHISVGYTSSWWSAEVRKIFFYGDDVTVARVNFWRKMDNNILVSLTMAETVIGSPKATSVVFSLSKSF